MCWTRTCCTRAHNRVPGFTITGWIAGALGFGLQGRAVAAAATNARVAKAASDIWTASRKGDVEQVKQEIATVSSFASKITLVNTPDPKGQYPLFLAVKAGHIGVVKVLLPYANRSTVNTDRISALHMAVNGSQTTAAEQLLIAGFPVDAQECGFTPWHLAVQKGEYTMAELLRKHGANVNTRISNPEMTNVTLLHVSTILNDSNLFNYVVNLPDTDLSLVDGLGETALYKAVASGKEEFVKALLIGTKWHSSVYKSNGKNSMQELLRLADEKGFARIKEILNKLNTFIILQAQRAS